MPDFIRPEYKSESYVELCRELELPRTFKEGDWYCLDPWEPPFAFLYTRDKDKRFLVLEAGGRLTELAWNGLGTSVGDESGRILRTIVWLPALSDWLDMLAKEGFPDATIRSSRTHGYYAYPLETGNPLSGGGPTREEAVARLWVAVGAPVKT